ncbi:MAG: hypothetical protein RIR00_1003 [Pseudomonadota bacterium]
MDPKEIEMKAKVAVIDSALGICALPEYELLKRLEALWVNGFSAAKETYEPILKDLSNEMTKVVMAHMSGDQERLKAVLDSFMQRHVKVVNPSQAKVH